ncbi:UNVERIFIED_CONTAM: hypothetical protein Slati_0893500 [Sesamum latifolium]|uniref:DUF4283 domain-containing protein n=1 Tax=Sesamum latifolium TaxID=2727402 RepID=A0AAW2XPN0_9LAMI
MRAPLALDAPPLSDFSRDNPSIHDEAPLASPTAPASLHPPLIFAAPLDTRTPPTRESLIDPAATDALDTPHQPVSTAPPSTSIPMVPTGAPTSIYPTVRDVTATSNGFLFYQFLTTVAMGEVIEGGPWPFNGQPIVMQKWEPGMVLRKLQHSQVPVWIKLRHLPVELWTNEGLSIVARGIGKPLYPDAITRACTRLDFARVCVMLDISSKLSKYIVIMVPREDGGESACKVDVEYEWLPSKCTACMSLGHPTKECPTTKPKPSPVSVYVQKPPQPIHREPARREPSTSQDVSEGEGTGFVDREDKGKAIVLYNAFDALMELDSNADVAKGHISNPTAHPDD